MCPRVCESVSTCVSVRKRIHTSLCVSVSLCVCLGVCTEVRSVLVPTGVRAWGPGRMTTLWGSSDGVQRPDPRESRSAPTPGLGAPGYGTRLTSLQDPRRRVDVDTRGRDRTRVPNGAGVGPSRTVRRWKSLSSR